MMVGVKVSLLAYIQHFKALIRVHFLQELYKFLKIELSYVAINWGWVLTQIFPRHIYVFSCQNEKLKNL